MSEILISRSFMYQHFIFMLFVLCSLELNFVYDDDYSFSFVSSMSGNAVNIGQYEKFRKNLKLLKLEKFAYQYKLHWHFWLVFCNILLLMIKQKYLCYQKIEYFYIILFSEMTFGENQKIELLLDYFYSVISQSRILLEIE